ncbi:RDD family protein [Helicobacter sp. 23-1046]
MKEKIQKLLERENLELAPLNVRFLAYLFDCFLVLFVCVIALWSSFSAVFNEEDLQNAIALLKTALWRIALLYTLAFFCYEVLLVSLYGATLGKMILKIRIVSVEFVDKPSIARAVVRAFCKCLGAIFLYVGFIMAFDGQFNRALHDKVSKTLVV